MQPVQSADLICIIPRGSRFFVVSSVRTKSNDSLAENGGKGLPFGLNPKPKEFVNADFAFLGKCSVILVSVRAIGSETTAGVLVWLQDG